MNDRIKTWLYLIISISVIGIVGYLAINLLIYLIPVLVVIYIIFKINGYIKRKTRPNSTTDYTSNYKSSYDIKAENVDTFNSEVIDVDYEDVKK